MKKLILNLLNIQAHEYELRVFNTYMDWCTKHAKSDKEMQRFLTSPALFNWWMQEYEKLERNFLALIKPYINDCDQQDVERLYLVETVQIFNHFCKPLIYTARYKHQNIVNPKLN